MLEWTDNIILLSSKPYGETGVIASVLSEKNGRYKGFVFGGNSKKKEQHFKKEIYARLIGNPELQNN